MRRVTDARSEQEPKRNRCHQYSRLLPWVPSQLRSSGSRSRSVYSRLYIAPLGWQQRYRAAQRDQPRRAPRDKSAQGGRAAPTSVTPGDHRRRGRQRSPAAGQTVTTNEQCRPKPTDNRHHAASPDRTRRGQAKPGEARRGQARRTRLHSSPPQDSIVGNTRVSPQHPRIAATLAPRYATSQQPAHRNVTSVSRPNPKIATQRHSQHARRSTATSQRSAHHNSLYPTYEYNGQHGETLN